MSVTLQRASFLLVALGVALVFMCHVDRVNQKRLFMAGAVLQIFALLLFAIVPLSLPVALGYVLLLGIGGGFAHQPFFQLWSSEMFPTLMRSTAQGLMFAVVRISLGIWSFFVPAIAKAGFHTLAWILTGFVAASALLGLLLERVRAGRPREPRWHIGQQLVPAHRRVLRDRRRQPTLSSTLCVSRSRVIRPAAA